MDRKGLIKLLKEIDDFIYDTRFNGYTDEDEYRTIERKIEAKIKELQSE